MKIAVYAVLSVVLLVLVVIFVGTLLPKKHVVARKISLHRSPAEVFSFISDFQSEPSWRRDVQLVVMQPTKAGLVGFVEKSKNGSIAMEVRVSNPPQRLVTEIADKSLPFGGVWIFDIAPDPQGCTLQITERGEIYNPFFRFVSRFILGYKKTMDTYLEDVANTFHESSPLADSSPAEH